MFRMRPMDPNGGSNSPSQSRSQVGELSGSDVLILSGHTFVLGGILQDSLKRDESGVPFLRSVPGLGWLFKTRSKQRVKDELLVFITPKLVQGVSTASLPDAQKLWENRPREATPPPASSAPVAAEASAARAS